MLSPETPDKIERNNFLAKEDPDIVRWVVALAMGTNDLIFSSTKISSTHLDYEQIYLFRLALAHTREIAKIVGETKKNEKINSFILTLPAQTQQTYLRITNFLATYEDGGFVKGVLKIPRDDVFHYPDVKGKYWSSLFDDIKALDKISINFSKNDKTILGVRYRFIDELLWGRAKQGLSKEIVQQLSAIAVDLISFIDYVFENLVRKNEKE